MQFKSEWQPRLGSRVGRFKNQNDEKVAEKVLDPTI